MKIEQIETQFAQKLDNPLKHILQELQYLVPDNYRSRVSLLDASGRKKRSNASADNWSPESGRIEIRFEPTRPTPEQAGTAKPAIRSEAGSSTAQSSSKGPDGNISRTTAYFHPAEIDLLKVLVKVLDRAESKPGWKFVTLKKFRDEVLPSEDIPSIRTDVERQNVIRSAIDKRFILVGRVPNPKAPEFPVTTIRVNRLMPEVKEILGGGDADLDFHPIEIKGEPLSATIIRERHR
ncbi:MAG: hypothetical protein ACHP8A_04895 [Terriglobales bacterium]|nr:hypothetical protein [Terriglobales bacterium]